MAEIVSTEIAPAGVGLACALCWGDSSSPFGTGFTPDKVMVQVADIEKGPQWIPSDGEPPNGTYILDQNSACKYTFASALTDILLEWTSGQSDFLMVKGAVFQFVGIILSDCRLSFEGGLSPGLQSFQNGTAIVTL